MSSSRPAAVVPDRTVRSAVRSTYAAFIGSGFAFSSWASSIPRVKDHLGLDPSQLGLVLLAIAAGSLASLPLAGPIVTRFGSRRTVATTAALLGAALVAVGLGYLGGVAPVVVGLFVFGFANGAWDVAMNVQGALVERRLGRAIMPRFHAGYSLGTVAGAVLGAAMIALDVSVTVHLAVVGVVVAVVVVFSVQRFAPDHESAEAAAEAHASGASSALTAWREPRTLLIGLFVLTFAFAEGTGNDWISVAVIDDYRTSPALGTLGFALFLAAMTAGRWFGPRLIDRFGRVVTARALGAVAVVGVLVFVFGGSAGVAFVGAVLWGGGIALGFPMGMSAGADDPPRAAARVSVIASIGYVAFLGGPPLIGFLGDHLTVLRALTAVAVMLAIALMIAGAVRPLPVPPERETFEPATAEPVRSADRT